MLRRLGYALVLAVLCTAPAYALSTTYSVIMSGANEVPGPGDPDGSASGTITLDDVAGSISWSFTYSALSTPTDMHIHGPGGSAGSAAGVFVGLGVATSGGAGTLISSTTTTPANIDAIFANPTDFYVNIHTTEFPGGAVRGQLGTVVPEPETAQLFGLGTVALAVARRMRRRWQSGG
jgi:CHRD domain